MKKQFSFVKPLAHLLFLAGIFTLAMTSCSENPQSQKIEEKTNPAPKHTIIKKPESSFNDTILINTKAAVFYNPDSIQMEKIKQVNEKVIYDMLKHDCHYQMQNARKALIAHWPQIKIYDAIKTRYLLFIKADHSKVLIDLNDKNDICGLFLFDQKKNPVLADMPNIETVLNLYFKP